MDRVDDSAERSVKPLHPLIGAEVRGVDLSRNIDADTTEWIKTIWARHLVLVFPEQRLSEGRQVRFSRAFGELAIYHERERTSPQAPEILRVSNLDEDGNIRDANDELRRYFTTLTGFWHTDGSYKAVPSLGSVLHALEVPPEGGETWFCNMFAAYEALPDEVKAKLQGRHMVHNQEVTRLRFPGMTPMSEAQKREFPPVTHPLVRTHGDGRRSLYLSDNAAYYVGGMALEDAKAFHGTLMELATKPAFIYRHRWRAGDVVMWDNRGTMHRVTEYDAGRYRRSMQRTEILGREVVD